MKRVILIFSLYSIPAFALYSVSLVSPIPGKTERIDISQIKEGGWLVTRTSNLISPKDYRIGKLKISTSPETKKLLARIQEIEENIKATDKLISESKEIDLESISRPEKGSHDDFVIFNKRDHSRNSPFFGEIESIIKDFAKLLMELTDGARLDAKQDNVELVKDGKTFRSFKFVKGAYCSGVQKNLKCLVRDWGVIYIQ